MSRSNPTVSNPHPASRWFEWDGANGGITYYDKNLPGEKNGKPTKGSNVSVKIPFPFLLLEETASIKGWHEKSESNIVSNEVRDTRDRPFAVRSFKGGEIANGLYAAIKDRVIAAGGHFNGNIYLGFKNAQGQLELGVLQLKGAAFSAWTDFRKASGKALFEQAVVITGSKDGQKGAVKFKTPVFALKEVSKETNDAAMELDKSLQAWLAEYFAKGVSKGTEQAQTQQPDASWLEGADQTPPPNEVPDQPITEGLEVDDIPF